MRENKVAARPPLSSSVFKLINYYVAGRLEVFWGGDGVLSLYLGKFRIDTAAVWGV